MAPRGNRPKPNRAIDVQNPLYREGEERVYQWLLSQGKEVQDVRPLNTYYDFILGSAWTLDVKVDTRAHETGRVAWEDVVEDLRKSGPEAFQPGWGRHHGLSFVAYVLLPAGPYLDNGIAPLEPRMWPVIVVNAQKLREAILKEGEGNNCKGFIVNGSDRRATGCAVKLDWLEAQGLVMQRGEV